MANETLVKILKQLSRVIQNHLMTTPKQGVIVRKAVIRPLKNIKSHCLDKAIKI